jgi:hypothetical protein
MMQRRYRPDFTDWHDRAAQIPSCNDPCSRHPFIYPRNPFNAQLKDVDFLVDGFFNGGNAAGPAESPTAFADMCLPPIGSGDQNLGPSIRSSSHKVYAYQRSLR